MSTHPFHAPSLVGALLLAGFAAPALAQTEWHTDFAAARSIAAERHAPLFVTFRCER
ncbi:MAG: hypothetical protein H6838_12685 [Planctomycetes bacterium]|nr:hypothetical protein [Planctomycetota bacterium]